MKFHPAERVLLKDNDAGWYLIPKELAGEFREQLSVLGSIEEYSEQWYNVVYDFDEAYLKYAIDSPDGLYTTGKSYYWENQ